MNSPLLVSCNSIGYLSAMMQHATPASILLGLLLVAGGCSKTKVVETQLPVTQERLLKLGLAYSQFCTQHKKPPTQLADLKASLGNTESSLTGDDGKPFTICWGVDFSKPIGTGQQPVVVAYESTGRDGKRYVLTTARNVQHLTDAEFRASNFPPGHKPQP
jgi:hypothetical protein